MSTPTGPPIPLPKSFVADGRHADPADTKITVFNQVFFVHSGILKQYSMFFRTFIQNAQSTLSEPIKYEFITKVVDNGADWILIGITTEAERGININENQFTGAPGIEQVDFDRLLCAIYSHRYQLSAVVELERLAKLADYYRALPAVSNSLLEAIAGTTFGRGIHAFAADLLPIAINLRHPALFRECLTQLMGPWNRPRFFMIRDSDIRRKLNNIAERTQNNICAKIAAAHQRLLELSLSIPYNPMYPPGWGQAIGQFMLAAAGWSMVGNQMSMPIYFRQLSTYPGPGGDDIRRALGQLLGSSLRLEAYSAVGAGQQGPHRDFRDFFLCSDIRDEDLPWDRSEVEW